MGIGLTGLQKRVQASKIYYSAGRYKPSKEII
jgi:hypothetical protein